MTRRDQQTLSSARQYKQELLDSMFGILALPAGVGGPPVDPLAVVPAGSSVLGVGFGVRETQGENLPSEFAVRVYVRSKLPRASLSADDIVPALVNGMPTDVVAVGDLAALVSCGCSVGHYAITAGTAGCLVRRAGSAEVFVLSNNHVLANSSDRAVGSPGGGPCAVGDAVLQPGPVDHGLIPGDVVAELASWVPLDFMGASNLVDAAIARVTRVGHFTPDISAIGRVAAPPVPAALYQSVRKWGRTTAHTVGVVMDIAASIRVRYGTSIAKFEDQLGIQGVGPAPFSQGGDSGSLIVDAVTKQAVGLLFAGGGSMTFANVIEDVLAHPAIAADII
jgi:hypothetical protein